MVRKSSPAYPPEPGAPDESERWEDPQPQLQEHPPEPEKEIPKEIAEIDIKKLPPLRIKIRKDKKGKNPKWELN